MHPMCCCTCELLNCRPDLPDIEITWVGVTGSACCTAFNTPVIIGRGIGTGGIISNVCGCRLSSGFNLAACPAPSPGVANGLVFLGREIALSPPPCEKLNLYVTVGGSGHGITIGPVVWGLAYDGTVTPAFYGDDNDVLPALKALCNGDVITLPIFPDDSSGNFDNTACGWPSAVTIQYV